MSGGQRQRVAIARALVTSPALVLADEPTGNLDTQTTIEVMALFQELNEEGVTIVLVTHEPEVAVYAKRIVEVRDGRIVRDEPVKNRRMAADDLEKEVAA
jgi:putative ABC transport system ATP-binding protein